MKQSKTGGEEKEDEHLIQINKAIKLCLADKYVSGEYLNNEIYSYYKANQTPTLSLVAAIGAVAYGEFTGVFSEQ